MNKSSQLASSQAGNKRNKVDKLEPSIEVDGVANKAIDNIRIVRWQHFVNHETKNTHHSCTTIVQFNSTFALLLLRGKRIPTEIDEGVSEISYKFTPVMSFITASSKKPTKRKI